MALYHNVMEEILEMEYDALKGSFNCCTCPQCRNDTIAYALNHLPARYVVNASGAVIVKLESWRQQGVTDVRSALTRAMMVVSANPRHDQKIEQE